MSQKAAIIGGGITGLSLAYFLLKKGIKAEIFEKEDHLGGLLATFRIENSFLEKFYHHFFVQDSAAFDLFEELGIENRLYWVYPRMEFYSGGRTYSFTTPIDLLRFKPLSFIERLKFGLFSLKVKQQKQWLPLEEISAKEWLVENLGENVYKKLWQPMLRGKFGSFADKIPASFVWFRIKARSQTRGRFGLREKLGYLKGSYQVLLQALVNRILEMGGEIKLNSGSSALPLSGYDFTIVTTPNARSFPDIKYLGNICLILKLKKRFSDFYWTNVGDENIPFCAVVEHTNAFDDKGYNQFKILYVSNYLEHGHSFWGMSDKEVFDKYTAGLKKINPEFLSEDVVEYFVFKDKFAQPIPTLGHSKKIPPFKVEDRLYYVSNAQIYPEDRGVSDSIRLACKFVKQL
ncbi:MAG: NAD(P)/FAD-dependent oxidoreductase [Candidatus Margulisiibacteriota bacterium]